MSDANDAGDKTEAPTPKRLADARKQGDVPKSREIGSTVTLVIWLAVGGAAISLATTRLAALFDGLFATLARGWMDTGFVGVLRSAAAQAGELTLILMALLLVPVAAVGLLTEFLQTGPVLSFEKVSPKVENLNPASGIKRMFSLDNLIQVCLALAKTVLLLGIGWLVVSSALPQILALAQSTTTPAQAVGALTWALTVKLLAWTLALFAILSVLDFLYQRHSFMKRMRMSLRDIKQEMKDAEGDPHIKQQRRALAQELAQRSSAQAAASANVLVVNPTHIAIAIDYDRENCPVPTIAAKGEEDVARAMREAAEKANVPIVRNIPLARDLLARAEEGEIIPSDLFDVIAEVILWAREVREHVQALRDPDPDAPAGTLPERKVKAPGEDLTHYPEPPWNPLQ